MTAFLLKGGRVPAVVVPPPAGMDPRARFALGMNLSGAETSNAQFPTSDEMGYFVQRGIRTFRLPLLWENVQPTANGALNSGYMANVSNVLAMAASLGATVLLDIHNYGAYKGVTLGQNSTPVSILADLWTRLSTWARADPNYAVIRGYDLMNEWHDMDPNAGPGVNSTAFSQQVISQANQAAINAIRANGDNKLIYIEGDHYTGAWDWVPNNGAWAAALTDPANNLIFSVHCYLDSDSSGTNFSWSSEAAKPGYAPPGTPTSVNIGPQRMAAVIAWAKQNGKRLHVGETGWSNDTIAQGGSDDFADWNQAAYNHILNCQNNAIEMDIWGAGPTFSAAYGYNPEPTSVANPSAKDFTAAGLQSTQMVVIEKFSGFAGSQPTAYRVDVPYGAIPYAPPGTAIPNFKIRYNGKIGQPITFTGHATLADGTDAGGTFTPASMPAGDNGLVTFSYTPAAAYAGIQITFTNNQGLTDPPAVGASSVSDFFTDQGSIAPNVYSLRRLVSTYVGPAIRLKRSYDGTEQDFYFNRRGDLPRQAIQDWAYSRTISVTRWYDQSPNRNDITFGSTSPNLVLVDASGYPSINVPGALIGSAGTPSVGTGQMSVFTRVNPSRFGDIITQDFYADSFRLTPSQFSYGPNSGPPTYVTIGATSGAWSDLAATYSRSYASGNLKGYLNGAQAQAVAAPPFNNGSQANAFNVFNFQFADQHFEGSITDLVMQYVEWTAAQVGRLHSEASSYYSTALPDSLGAVQPPPPVTEPALTPPNGTFSPRNYKGINLSGPENVADQFPTPFELDYYAAKGFGIIRLPIQPGFLTNQTGKAALDTTMVGRLKNLLDYAFNKGLRVIIDLHSYGYINKPDGSGGAIPIAVNQTGTDCFVDIWTRIASRTKNYPNVVFGLMNEPGNSGATAAQWKAAAVSALQAIRATGANQLVLLQGPPAQGAHDWITSGNAAAWAGFNGDPANNFAFEMHQYLDSDDSGSHPVAVSGKGATVLSAATTWARQNGFKAFLGEFGWAPQTWLPSAQSAMNYDAGATPITTGGPAEGDAILSYMDANSDVWMGWTYWNGGHFPSPPDQGGYAYYAEPPWDRTTYNGFRQPLTEQPQMAQLTAHV